jgi:protein-S-isoprenylcysteine O-methyltransferase Ste14
MQAISTNKPRRWILPPVVLVAAILLSLALDRWLPIAQLWGRPWTWVGGGIIVAMLVINSYCALEFRRRRTTVIPFHVSTALITNGFYNYSRNPIYLSMVVLLCGLAMALGSLSPWVVPPLFLMIISRRFIRHEETMLAETFGKEYQEYRQCVRRWL